MKKGYINKLLFDTRIAKKLDRKQASKLLHVSQLYLKLVEIGYLKVSKRRQKKFIKGYALDKDFFQTNSNYVISIEKPQEKPKQAGKIKKIISKGWVRWTALGLTCANIAMVGYGVYAMYKPQIKPRDKWTSEFTTFRNGMKNYGEKHKSILYPGDDMYVVGRTETVASQYEIVSSIATYGSDSTAADTSVDSTYKLMSEPEAKYKDYITANGYFSFYIFVYNKRAIAYCQYENPSRYDGYYVPYVTTIINGTSDYTLKPFRYYVGNGLKREEKKAEKGSTVYKAFTNIFRDYLDKSYKNFNKLFEEKKAEGKDLGYLQFRNLLTDLIKISKDYFLHFRLGIWLTVLGAVFGVLFIFIMSLSFYFFYKHKKKSRYVTINQSSRLPRKLLLADNKHYSRDTKLPLFIPEFVLSIVGIVILAVAAISTIFTTYLFFEGEWLNMIALRPYRQFATNMLAAGITILMFVKLDVYSNKSIKQLVISICAFLLGGIAFYVFELTVFRSFRNVGSIFSILIDFMRQLIPGNFIWPLGLFAAMFLFLFTEPDFVKGNSRNIKIWRSMSAFPTFFMVFSLFWKFLINPNVSAPDYISFLFYSKGTLLTLFMLLYIFGMFGWQVYCRRKIGYNYSKYVFFNSRRYFVQKNIIAASILFGLLIFDLIFRFALPDNSFDLGQGWAIGIIIPFVLFYHPHIGKRNNAVDIPTTILNIVSSTGGFIGSIGLILERLNFGDIFYIIN